ncbi:insulinase family protein [Mesorhizobium sp. BR1-1-3]|uniref:M16 family metallopeptidase n=1 Tax=Mesorhizobium sp. BR1-1-3 TaxID=2876651 RepID=UPI001CD0FDB6|nr:pitrilysin family protein [Mesorhizobium sp. BR1-1-3]MBZ9886973.1 insulinase family protein [Mesorhizobium sp. BR1-1-3]
MRGVPAWRRRRSVTHPSTVSALRADPPSPTRGEGRALAALTTLFLSILFLILPALTARAMEIQSVTSPKGITAWLVEDYSVPVVAIRFVFGGGSTQDPVGKEGLANLMTGLFDEGAGPLDSEDFQIKLDDAGAEMSFDESRDGIYGSMRMLAEQRDQAFDLLRLAVNEPRFDQLPIDRIRSQILSGIIAGENDPDTVAQNKWARALYGDHPYSRSDQGTKESIAAITSDDLKALHKAVFARGGLHVAVVGAIDAETLKKKLDMVFGDLPQNQALRPVADIDPKLAQHIEVDYDLPQTSLQLAFPGVKRKAADFFPAVLMNEILGGGTFTSRLFQEVREKRGLAYSVNSSLINQDHANALIVSTGTRSDRAAETLGIVRDVVKQLAEQGPTEAELAATKKYMIGAYAINNLDSSSAIASTLVELQLDDLGIDYMQRRAGYINAVTLEQVKAAAKKLLTTEPTIMVIGPKLAGAGKG